MTASGSQRLGVHLLAVESAVDMSHAAVASVASAVAAVAPPAARTLPECLSTPASLLRLRATVGATSSATM